MSLKVSATFLRFSLVTTNDFKIPLLNTFILFLLNDVLHDMLLSDLLLCGMHDLLLSGMHGLQLCDLSDKLSGWQHVLHQSEDLLCGRQSD